MKKILVGLFYTLQGIGNLTFALSAFTSDPKFGVGIGFFLLLPSIFSLLTVWELLRKKIAQTRAWGMSASILFILFWGISIVDSYNSIVLGHYVYHYSILLIVSLLIIVLNVVSVFGLFGLAKDKRI